MDKAIQKPLLYLDYLGFSEKILSQSTSQSIDYYKNILNDLEIFRNTTEFKVNFDIVSDSAFVWIDGADMYEETKELFRIASTLSHNSLFMKRPIRGAIVFDDFIIGDKVFNLHGKKISTHLILGRAIIGGYRWEQAQDWFGISINPFYLKIFEEKLSGLLKELKGQNKIIYYNIPTKHGEIKSYAINCFSMSHVIGLYKHGKDKKDSLVVPTYASMIKQLKDKAKDFSVLNKLTHTENFLEHVISNALYPVE